MSPERKRQKRFGAFYTPENVVEFLVKWAVRTKNDLVLDPSSGGGVFMKKAFEQIHDLGLDSKSSKEHIFGIEYDKLAFEKLRDQFKGFTMINSSFFDVNPNTSVQSKNSLPLMDAVIGNPPYIERERLEGISAIRRKINSSNLGLNLHRVTDVYGYFLIHATNFLKDNGRLAFIISDSWLNMNFGKALKEFLLRHYNITAIIGFEERVFADAQVRTILILAENSASENNPVRFIRLRNHRYLEKLHSVLEGKQPTDDEISVTEVEQAKLNPSDSWGVYLKASSQYFNILSKSIITPLKELADIGIGLQSLKNDFYILSKEKVDELQLEKEFFDEIVMSTRECPLVIKNKKEINNLVLYCNKSHENLKNTNVLQYIKNAETTKVSQRGKTKVVIGCQNIPRINYTSRSPWYNIIPEIEKRCRGTIILPRRSFIRFFAAWNKTKVVVNDNFINIEPKKKSYVLPLLAILNSSFTEYLCRVRSQTYGGGVFDLRPEDVKNLPCLDLNMVPKGTLDKLSKAYQKFINSDGTDKTDIDRIIMKDLLRFRKHEWEQLTKEKESLQLLALTSNGRTITGIR